MERHLKWALGRKVGGGGLWHCSRTEKKIKDPRLHMKKNSVFLNHENKQVRYTLQLPALFEESKIANG